MPTGDHYLSTPDLEKIKRVLTTAPLPKNDARAEDEAARFLMRKFQEGVTGEASLAWALARYIEQRQDWRRVPEK
ncbi:hypothetical protein M2281_002545 [Mesorhizobium soli]|uniref:hypothetical protein n=1 Tax=Pseudaminobacter soli (ex Li et al. 2025) TaxID=1295366 RepID=UPI002473646D|nr:hypothetical protein [Mesorhizobium soli]MDH6231947.1 hypothetical protein [Mesorhizobium soli]